MTKFGTFLSELEPFTLNTSFVPNFYADNVIEFEKFSYFMWVSFLLCYVLISLVSMDDVNSVLDNEKISQYECGFEPFDDATRRPFDVHFYIVGILFLIFDVEVVLLFPWIANLYVITLFGFWVMIFFLLILLIGFYYEWDRGALNWPDENI